MGGGGYFTFPKNNLRIKFEQIVKLTIGPMVGT